MFTQPISFWVNWWVLLMVAGLCAYFLRMPPCCLATIFLVCIYECFLFEKHLGSACDQPPTLIGVWQGRGTCSRLTPLPGDD